MEEENQRLNSSAKEGRILAGGVCRLEPCGCKSATEWEQGPVEMDNRL
jgi:hypothetical protein